MKLKDKFTQIDLIKRVKEIEPIIRKHTQESEENRKLSEPVIEALKNAGMFKIWKPEDYGGYESDPITAFTIFEELARIDSAVGWNVQLTAGRDLVTQWLSTKAMDEVFFNTEDVIFAGAWHPFGYAVPVDGGFNISGHWEIASGCQYANWFFHGAMIMDGDQPLTYENGQPQLIYFILPAEEGKVVEAWDAMGMKGTGSHDITIENKFVPAYRTAPMLPIENAVGRAYQGALYKNSLWYTIAALASPSLGIARAAIEDFMDIAYNKTPIFTQNKLKENPYVQTKLAEAEAILGAGKAYLYEVLRTTWGTALQGHRINMQQKMQIQLASLQANEASIKAVRIIQNLSGLTGLRETSSIQKHFRDIHILTKHTFVSPSRYQAVGQLMLGLEPNWAFFYF